MLLDVILYDLIVVSVAAVEEVNNHNYRLKY
jgi:hypothetical protein